LFNAKYLRKQRGETGVRIRKKTKHMNTWGTKNKRGCGQWAATIFTERRTQVSRSKKVEKEIKDFYQGSEYRREFNLKGKVVGDGKVGTFTKEKPDSEPSLSRTGSAFTKTRHEVKRRAGRRFQKSGPTNKRLKVSYHSGERWFAAYKARNKRRKKKVRHLRKTTRKKRGEPNSSSFSSKRQKMRAKDLRRKRGSSRVLGKEGLPRTQKK